ncbi:MAG: ABC transporter substrate-binding protein [Polyangiaceae bacterium]
MLRRRSVLALFATADGRAGALLIGSLTLLSFLVGPLLADPLASDFSLGPALDGGPPLPSWRHWLGTDAVYRDELARLAAGGRVSLLIGLGAASLAVFVGLGVGVGAAMLDRAGLRRVEWMLMRALDVLMAFPFLLLIATISVLVARRDPWTMTLVLGLTGWTGVARVVRTRAISVLAQDFVLSARASGASALRIARVHVLPNVLGTAIALGTGLVGSMVLAEAVLGYLAVGLPPPYATWGRMLHEGEATLSLRPSLVAAPAACILVTLLGFFRLGEALTARVDGARDRGLLSRAGSRLSFPLDLGLVALGLGLVVLLPRAELAGLPAAPTAPTPRRGGVVHLATAYPARTLDPALASDETALAVDRLVFGRLVSLDAAGTIRPGITVDLAWQADRRALRLTLRRGLKFQDGTPLLAADVKRSIERALGPAVASPGASQFSSIAGFAAFRAGKATELAGLRTEGELVVVFELERADATLPSLLTLPYVVPVCASMPAPAPTSKAPLCGAGPFVVRAFDSESGVSLARNDLYYDAELPYLDGVEMTFGVRPQAQRYKFERGELDLVRELTSADAARFRAHPGWSKRLGFVDKLRTSSIYLNTTRGPFTNRSLRRAVAAAIDSSVLTRLRPDVAPLETVVPRGVPGRPEGLVGRRHDLTRALEAMREAGYAYDPVSGQGGYPEPIDYLTVPDTFEQVAAEIYQQQLARIGIRIRLRLSSALAQQAEAERGLAPMGWTGWQADYPDPITFFDPRLLSEAIGPDQSQNVAFYANPDLDALIERARSTPHGRDRDELFIAAERIVAEDAPYVPTVETRGLEISQPWLFGYAPDALSSLDLTEAFIAKDGGDGALPSVLEPKREGSR